MDSELLRPAAWDEYIGQERVKMELDVAISAAKAQERPLGHVFLAAPAGSGKTSLASLIADRLEDPFEALSMSGLTPKAFAAHFRYFPGGVVLLDEIHAATRTVQDMLNTLLEEGYVTSPGGYRIDVGPWLTIVAATTEPEKVASAVRQKFEHKPRFSPYSEDEMRRIVQRMAGLVNIELDDTMANALGQAAGGVPRNARHLVLKARDLQLRNNGCVTVEEVLTLAGVCSDGLSEDHIAYLAALDNQMGIAGMATLQMILGLHESDLRELERLLLERGLILYGNRGRELTKQGAQRVRPTPVRRAA